MKAKRPALVSYIADLNFLNAFLLLASLFPALVRKIGVIVPSLTVFNVIVRLFVIVSLLVISYGLLSLKRWGYQLMIAYNMLFLVISIISLFQLTKHPFFYNPGFIVSVLGLSLSFSAQRYFKKGYIESSPIYKN